MSPKLHITSFRKRLICIYAMILDVRDFFFFLYIFAFVFECCYFSVGRSSHPSLAAGAALQVTLHKLQFDYYPYHLAAGDRNRWPGYRSIHIRLILLYNIYYYVLFWFNRRTWILAENQQDRIVNGCDKHLLLFVVVFSLCWTVDHRFARDVFISFFLLYKSL